MKYKSTKEVPRTQIRGFFNPIVDIIFILTGIGAILSSILSLIYDEELFHSTLPSYLKIFIYPMIFTKMFNDLYCIYCYTCGRSQVTWGSYFSKIFCISSVLVQIFVIIWTTQLDHFTQGQLISAIIVQGVSIGFPLLTTIFLFFEELHPSQNIPISPYTYIRYRGDIYAGQGTIRIPTRYANSILL